MEQRPPRGVWGGLWSPPERDAGASVRGFLDQAGIAAELVDDVQAAGVFRHGFTHYDLDVEPVYVRLKARPAAVRERAGRWMDPRDHRLGLSKVAARLVGVTTLFAGPTSGPLIRICDSHALAGSATAQGVPADPPGEPVPFRRGVMRGTSCPWGGVRSGSSETGDGFERHHVAGLRADLHADQVDSDPRRSMLLRVTARLQLGQESAP